MNLKDLNDITLFLIWKQKNILSLFQSFNKGFKALPKFYIILFYIKLLY